MGVTAPPADPSQMGGGGGGALPPGAGLGGVGGGQGVQILQQIQDLLSQLLQVEQEPNVQRAVNAMLQLVDPLMQAVGQSDQQNMTSGLANPGAPLEAGENPAEEAGESPATEAAEGPSPTSYGGAKKAAMANFREKGHFSKSGSKGEQLQTQKTKNRTKGK